MSRKTQHNRNYLNNNSKKERDVTKTGKYIPRIWRENHF